MSPTEDDALSALLTVMGGPQLLEALVIAVELDVPDRLAQGPRAAADLAAASGAVPERLERLLRALTTVGMVEEPEPGLFAATAATRMLQRDVPGSMRAMVRLRAAPFQQTATAALRRGVLERAAPFELATGMPYFGWLARHPEDAAVFDAGMTAMSGVFAPTLLAAIDLASTRVVMDVGGGQGRMLAGLLRAHPQLHGILFDLPSVVARPVAPLTEPGLAERVRIEGGDFFAGLPAGADAIVLSRILHDWGDQDCSRVLASCRRALPEGGRLLIVEFVLVRGPMGVPAALFDLHMMMLFGDARERSEAEYRALLAASGFRLDRVVAPAMAPNVVEAVAV